MKTITTTLLILASLLIGCGNATEDDSYDNEQIQTLKAIQSNMSEEEYQYKISAVEEGIKSWENDIKFEHTTSNDEPFMIYFVDRDCLAIRNERVFKFCLVVASNKYSTGAMFPFLDANGFVENATIFLFNDTFNSESFFDDLSKIVSHELGHVYGFAHNNNYDNVMSPYMIDLENPDESYKTLMHEVIKNKTIPLNSKDKFQLLPPQQEVIFHINTDSARIK